MKSLTDATVTRLKDGSIHLKGLEKSIGLDTNGYVLLIGTASKFIRVLPLQKDRAILVRVSFAIDEFPKIAREVLRRLKALDLKLIHSTGFCPLETECIWEGYFEYESQRKIDEFVEWLRGQEVVYDVMMKVLSV